MNVIFLDFDGVLDTVHFSSKEDVEKKVEILAEICEEYECKIVIEASAKEAIDEETLEVYGVWVTFIFSLFDKYGIECIGRTPTVCKRYSSYKSLPIWKEDEIRLYLFRHPEIEHYCIIDDDDFFDLEKVKDHLVKTIYYSDNPEEEGLLRRHKDEVGKVLKKENKIRKLVMRNIVIERKKRYNSK